VIGLLPYIYEPAAAYRGPAYNYGDPSTLIRWFHQVTVYYQRGGLFQYPLLWLPGRFWRYFGTLATEFPYFWWLGGIGLVASLGKRDKKYPVFLLFMFVLALVPIMTYKQVESVLRAHFYYESYLLVAIWIGLGAAWLLKALKALSSRADRLVQYAVLGLAAMLVLLCPLSAAVVHYDKVDKSNYYFARDMATDMLETVERDGVLVVSHDNVIFPVMYMQIAEGLRDDVNVVSTVAVGVPGFGGTNLLEFIPPGYAAKSGSDNYSQIVERNSDRLAMYTTIPEVIRPDWTFNWLGFVARVKAGRDGALPPEQRGPVRLPGSGSGSFKDSDARWSIYFPEAMRAMTSYSAKDYRASNAVYGYIIPRFQKDMYVPTLYGCADFSQYYELWGQVLNILARYGDTVGNLPNCYAIDPDFVSISLARAYAALDDFPNAIEQYERFITLDPEQAVGHTELGEVYLHLGDNRNAERELKESLRLTSNNARAHYLYGRALMLEGRSKEARRELETAVSLDPSGQIGEFARDTLKQLTQ
jgi:tetratricopeptide (TPR) repeat protein